MKTVFVTVLFAAVLCAAAIVSRRSWTGRQAEKALATGEPQHAFELYGQLRASRPWFLDRRELDVRYKAAATAALPVAASRHGFALAKSLATTIISGPGESGYEGEARESLDRLPDQHLQWIVDLLDHERIDDAVRECETAKGLYSDRPGVLERLRGLNARGLVARAETALTAGDPELALRTVATLGPSAPIPVQIRAVKLTRGATGVRAQWQIANRDFPGLLRGFDAALQTLRDQPDLARAVTLEYGAIVRQVFEMPAASVDSPLDVDELPSATTVGPSPGSGMARLAILNETGALLTVSLRGPRDYRTTIAPDGSALVETRAGEYAQAAFGARSSAVPYLGVIQLTAAEHRQAFTIRERGDPQRKPRPAAAHTLAMNGQQDDKAETTATQ